MFSYTISKAAGVETLFQKKRSENCKQLYRQDKSKPTCRILTTKKKISNQISHHNFVFKDLEIDFGEQFPLFFDNSIFFSYLSI